MMLIREIHLDDSTMSHKQFLQQSQLLEKCLHIQSQRNGGNIQPFVTDQASCMNSVSGNEVLQQDADVDRE